MKKSIKYIYIYNILVSMYNIWYNKLKNVGIKNKIVNK